MTDDPEVGYAKSSARLTDQGVVFSHAGPGTDKLVKQGSPYHVPYEDIVAIDYRAPNIAINGYITVATSPGLQPHKQRNPHSVPVALTSAKKKRAIEDFKDELLRRSGLSELTKFEYESLFQSTLPRATSPDVAPAQSSATVATNLSVATEEGGVVEADAAPGQLSRIGKWRAEAEARQPQRSAAKSTMVDLFGADLLFEKKLKFGEQAKISSLKKDFDKSVALQAHLQQLVDQANSFTWSANRETQIFTFGPVTLFIPEATTVTRQSGRLSGQGHLGVGFGHVGVGFSSGQRLNSRSVTTAGADQLQSKGPGILRITTRGVTFSGGTRVVSSHYGDLVNISMTGRRVVFTDQRNQTVWAVSASDNVDSEIYGIVQELRSLEKRVTAGFHLDQFDEVRVREIAGRWPTRRIEEQEKARQALNDQYRAVVVAANERGR